MRGQNIIVAGMLLLLLLPVFSLSGSSQGDVVPVWNSNWSYQQELQLPINTNDSTARLQPIDLRIAFENPCWTVNENETALRVVCWDGTQWHELESQIYDLDQLDVSHLKECNVVFLVPTFADGNERYFIYYDDSETAAPRYTDHVSVQDASYSYSPISDISAEAKFYGIREDGYCVYGVGQEGQLLDRACSQVVVKQKKNAKEFDVLGSDQIVSFAFSYYYGSREKDESSSDQVLVDKKVLVDGNLMVEFGIISESKKKDIQTIAIYTYYYFPGEEKRIDVQVKHQMLKEATVQGIDNVDGRFGSIISIKSRSAAVESMNFGEIYPYLDFYAENNDIEEYQMNLDPATKEREWIISFKDDADLGTNAWMCYGEGKEGYANAVIFSSNEGVVISGTDERDGFQIKIAEKEYFNFLGTEVDYASINFGRNSYEPGYSHDMMIPSDLEIRFDAEVFASETGGYPAVEKEASLYQTLVKSRRLSSDVPFERQQKRYNVTVITHFGGTHLTFPWFANRTGRGFPVMWIELYKDGQLITSGAANRSFFIRASRTFSGVPEGEYLIKVFWKQGNTTKVFTGTTVVSVEKNTTVHVFCTWERVITVSIIDQHGKGISGVHARLLNNEGVLFDENITQTNGELIVKAPYNPRDPYTLQAVYKDFIVYDKELQKTLKKLDVQVDLTLYNITVEVTDTLGLPPGVDLAPTLVTVADERTIQLTPQDHGEGTFFFERIPPGDYTLQISYGNVVDETQITVSNNDEIVQMKFTASFDLTVDLFDSHGNPLDDSDIAFEVLREDTIVLRSEDTTFSLPPAHYTINAFTEEQRIGTKDVEFTNDRHLTFVTTISSLLPTIIIGLLFVFLCFLFVLAILKKFSVPSLLKSLAVFIVVLALFQPWWEFNGTSTTPAAERNTAMYVNPGVMIETTTYSGQTTLEIAEMPDIFLAFLGAIAPVAVLICLVLGLSIILKRMKKKTYAFMLCIGGIILLVFLLPTFYYGTAKLTETSIGAVQGDGPLTVSIGPQEVLMQSHWGLSSGFYCIIIATVIAVIALVLEIRSIMKKRTRLSTQNSTQK